MVTQTKTSLIEKAGVADTLNMETSTENAWIEVIHKMDAVYADLVSYQVELEQKNIALEEAQQFIRNVLESMTDVLIVCDIHGIIQQVNRALENMTGLSETQWLNRPLSDLFGDDANIMTDNFPDRLGSDGVYNCEISITAFDGKPAPLEMNCASRFDNKGRLQGMVLIGRPVGELRRAYKKLNSAHIELKQAQQNLVHSEKMASLGRLVAGVAHELNNPISFVFGNMHALQRYGDRVSQYILAIEKHVDNPQIKQLRKELRIEKIINDIVPLIDGTLEGATRVSEIVQDLRTYSGSHKSEKQRYELTDVINTSIQWVLNACRYTPAINCNIPEQLYVTGHKGQVQQILVNLIQNAVDVLESISEPTINIDLVTNNNSFVIRIHDNGTGIPDDSIDKLFEPFYTTKPVGKGTGLGLSICYGMANEMDGTLKAYNHADGGAVFELSLPMDE